MDNRRSSLLLPRLGLVAVMKQCGRKINTNISVVLKIGGAKTLRRNADALHRFSSDRSCSTVSDIEVISQFSS